MLLKISDQNYYYITEILPIRTSQVLNNRQDLYNNMENLPYNNHTDPKEEDLKFNKIKELLLGKKNDELAVNNLLYLDLKNNFSINTVLLVTNSYDLRLSNAVIEKIYSILST